MEEYRRRPAPDARARARAMARRRRRIRQRRIIIGTGILLLALMITGIVYGVSSFKKNKAREALRSEGIAAMESGDYEGAIGKLESALADSGKKVGKFEADVLSYRGEAEYRLKDYQAALHTYTLLTEEDGKKEPYLRMLCLIQMELGNYEEALSYGLADARVYNRMAMERIEAKDYDSALAHIEKGIATGDQEALRDLSFNQVVAYEGKGDFKKALELLEAYAATYGSDAEVERELTFLRTRQGDGGA